MEEIGREVRRTLQIIPAQVRIREDWYYMYACQRCKLAAEKTPIVKAKKNPSVIPGGFASPEAIAQIMTQKFVMGSPLYRQELERMGVRYFDEALKVLPKVQRNALQVYRGWAYCNQLFALEDKLKKCGPEERYTQRQKKAKPILDAFLRWTENRNAAPQSAFGKAIHYLLEQ